jgi:hypothetical protein
MIIGKAIPTDIYDKNGNLIKIEFHDTDGEFIIEALWDERDPQDAEHRDAFREWAYRIADQIGYEVQL